MVVLAVDCLQHVIEVVPYDEKKDEIDTNYKLESI